MAVAIPPDRARAQEVLRDSAAYLAGSAAGAAEFNDSDSFDGKASSAAVTPMAVIRFANRQNRTIRHDRQTLRKSAGRFATMDKKSVITALGQDLAPAFPRPKSNPESDRPSFSKSSEASEGLVHE
ncbi:MAG TPA: hypothetical protein VGP63_04345 [Planctomycetaceae bacterium]|jgi:hypothetical protein|nr:hypothetical protein [Planctomycetaceae bacterium]